MEHDDIDEDIERLNIILQDDDGEDGESDGELRILENNGRVIFHSLKFIYILRYFTSMTLPYFMVFI
jgi:hypothetical protein